MGMARVDVSINGRSYPVQCEDGQVEHVRRLAIAVDEKVRSIARAVPASLTDAHLLVLASLTIADQLAEMTSAQVGAALGLPPGAEPGVLSERIDALTVRIENLAVGLERS
jgi:cell division protein ZapA